MFNADYEKRLILGASPVSSPTKSSGPFSPQKFSDRFIPNRAENDWDKRFSRTIKSLRTKNKDNDTFLRMYPHILENELLDGGIENVTKQGVQVGENSVPIPRRNLFTYLSPKREQTVLSTHYLSPISSSSNKLLAYREKRKQIQKTPYKVLDAPELCDDFYLNLLDWSSKDILSVGLGSSVYNFAAKTSQVTKLLDFSPTNAVTSVSWAERGDLLAVGTQVGAVQVWDTTENKMVVELQGHASRVGAMAWNGNVLATGSQDRRIVLSDVRAPQDARPVMELNRHRQEVCGLRWAPGNVHLASGGNDNRLYIWDKRNPHPLQTYTDHQAAIKAMAWSPHQQNVLATGSGTADRHIRFYNILLGRMVQSQDTGSQVCNLAWSKTSSQLVTTHGYSQNQIVVWQYPTLIKETELKGHSTRVVYLAVSPDGGVIVTGAGDETLRFWRVFTESPTTKEHKSVFDLVGSLR